MGKVIVIGAGAAGMMAAYAAAKGGHQVVLLEKNEKLGKKVYITGKGRCNVTNAGDTADFFRQVVRNPKTLYSAVYSFDAFQVEAFMEEYGCKLKTERGNRVFPQSDHASDIIRACACALEKAGVCVRLNTKAAGLLVTEGKREAATRGAEPCGADGKHAGAEERVVRGVRLADAKTMEADAVIVATGGLSYQSTGSDGDGLRWAQECGIQTQECLPALVPLVTKETWCAALQGLSLKNVNFTLAWDGDVIFSQQGEMLFTHFGISGPLVLSASSYYADALRRQKHAGKAQASIDLKPALTEEQLDRRLVREFDDKRNKRFKNALDGLFPSKLIPVMVRLSGIAEDMPLHELTKAQRKTFVSLIKHLPLTVTGTRGFEEAIITQGGVSVKEVNPSTMECRKIKGLYFAGEILDTDALTGGYNLQIAWSTGHLAGASIPAPCNSVL